MELKQLECFIAVADELNFSTAAEKVYLSQPSLSRHIQNLETELGVYLFKRDKKTVELTKAGIQLLATAKDVLNSINEISFTAQSIRMGHSGNLRIGYQGTTHAVIPTLLSDFHEHYPDINIVVEEYGAKNLLERVINGDKDIAICFSHAMGDLKEYSELNNKTFIEDEMVLFMNKKKYDYYMGLSETKGRKPVLKDFTFETFYTIDRDINPKYYDFLQKVYVDHGLIPNIPARQPTIISTLALMLLSGFGVAFLPKRTTLSNYPTLCYIEPEDVHEKLPIEVLWSKNNFNPAINLFLDQLG